MFRLEAMREVATLRAEWMLWWEARGNDAVMMAMLAQTVLLLASGLGSRSRVWEVGMSALLAQPRLFGVIVTQKFKHWPSFEFGGKLWDGLHVIRMTWKKTHAQDRATLRQTGVQE
ncbi:hypothetical protein B0H13DRAFT_1880354 [Mycena leptocephala]|nr:hypothetical protein B0H13DRAFT_1880354 [Mycena leptocephala]